MTFADCRIFNSDKVYPFSLLIATIKRKQGNLSAIQADQSDIQANQSAM